jgi:hypothetical protein
MSGTIHLILEDQTDADVVRAILKANGYSTVKVKPHLTTGGRGGISRLALQLPRLIATARAERGDRDCIAVLHDKDELTETRREHHTRIEDICRNHDDVKHIVAEDEIEAWLLADEGVCRWLGVKASNQDSLKKPKSRLDSLINKKVGKGYSGPTRQKVLDHVGGENHSPSLNRALAHLENAPCVG